MSNFSKERISKKTNEDLADVLANQEDYVSEAIDCVKAEFRKRGISKHELDALLNERILIREEKFLKRNAHLTIYEKVFCIIFPVFIPLGAAIPFIGFILPGPPSILYMYENGYYTKASQTMKFALLGILSWVSIIVLAIKISQLTSR